MKKFLWGAFLGGIAGSLSALMFTKKTGEEFRDDLADQFIKTKATKDKLVEEIEETRKDFISRAKDLVDDAKCAAEQIFKDAQKEGRNVLKQNAKRRKKRR